MRRFGDRFRFPWLFGRFRSSSFQLGTLTSDNVGSILARERKQVGKRCLLLPQRQHRIDAGGAAGGKVAGGERDETEHAAPPPRRQSGSAACTPNNWLRSRRVAARLTARRSPGRSARAGRPSSASARARERRGAPSAMRTPEFVRAPRHVERQHAVDAGRRQRQTERGERAEQRHREARLHTSWPSISLSVIGRPAAGRHRSPAPAAASG